MMEPRDELAQFQAMAQHNTAASASPTPAVPQPAATTTSMGKMPVAAVAAVPAVAVAASATFGAATPAFATAPATPFPTVMASGSSFRGGMTLDHRLGGSTGEPLATTATTVVAARPQLVGGASASSVLSSEGGFGSTLPRLFDSSTREGSYAGGTPVWLHGDNFTRDLVVRFGGVAATHVNVVSPYLIKCKAPPFAPLVAQQLHEVAITLAVASTNTQIAGEIPFAYVVSQPGASQQTSQELVLRLLNSLERAQAASAAASATSAGEGGSSIGGALDATFGSMDEHGYTLAEYANELRTTMGAGGAGPRAGTGDASELHMQHQDLAAMLKRERLSASLAKRPSLDLLQQRNILPDAEQASQRRQTLLHSLANRPAVEQLQARHILHTADEKQEQLAKRKRLEGFLAERPTPEQFQAQFSK